MRSMGAVGRRQTDRLGGRGDRLGGVASGAWDPGVQSADGAGGRDVVGAGSVGAVVASDVLGSVSVGG